MKKVLVLISLILFSGIYFLTMIPKANATSTVDQYCGNTNLQSYESIHRNGTDYRQAFIPVQNRVNSIAVKVGGNNISGLATLRVYTTPTGTSDPLLRSDRNFTNLDSTVSWYFDDFGDITLIPGTTYYVSLTSSVDFLYWYSVDSAGCTAPGMAYLNGVQQGYKLDFATFGFTYTAPANNNTNSSNSNTNAATNTNTNSATIPAGQSAGSGAVPVTTTSASIKAASGLTALYSSGAANLAWTASTTSDIDGYKIFRSESETTGFTEIGKTVKATVQYVDTNALTVGKTYYYFVRAYKSTAQSASTTTVALLIPETSAATNTNTNRSITPIATDAVDYTDYGTIQLYWILGWVVCVLVVILVAYEIDKKKKGGFVGAKHFRLFK